MTLTRSGTEIADYFAAAIADLNRREPAGQAIRPRFNIAPSQDVLVIAPGADEAPPELLWKQWGLVPSWAKDPRMGGRLFNARSETVDTKPSFRSAFKRRRCLVVADGFYEWTPKNRDHQPYHFKARSGALLAMAGLFESWQGQGGEVIDSCTVLTTEANADLQGVHHRMPVLMSGAAIGRWLDLATDPAEAKELTGPSPDATLERFPVDRRVNSPRFDDPSCLAPPSTNTSAAKGARSGSLSSQGELFDLAGGNKTVDGENSGGGDADESF